MGLSETTVVTAIYPLRKSKHGVRNYMSWIRNFCEIPCAMVIFTTEELALELYELRRPFLTTTQIIVRPFDSFAMTCPSMMEFWTKQHAIDGEKAIHSPELYAVWALKQEFVRIAANKNPFQSTWFVWCDMGIQRYPNLQPFYMNFPNRIPELCEHGRMHFLEVERIPDSYVSDWVEEKPMVWPTPWTTLGGGCIVADAETWEEFGEAYKQMLQEFARRGWFAGKDQTVFFTILMERKMKKPYRLFFPNQFSRDVHGVEWMSFPVILGGTVDAVVDTRFEPTD